MTKFKDVLVRCSACGTEFVDTVRDQRERAKKGQSTEPPSFCTDCRGDVRLAGADAPAEEVGAEEQTAKQPSASDEASRDDGRDQPARTERERDTQESDDKPRKGDGKGKRRRRSKSKSRRKPQTDIRIRHIGTVKWFDPDRGYGFIAADEGEEIFVHTTGIIVQGFDELEQGQPVEYEVEYTDRGPQAVDVVPLAV